MSKPKNRTEMAKALQEQLFLDGQEVSMKEAFAMLDVVTNLYVKCAAEDGAVNMGSFLKIEKRSRAERTGRNPQSGESMVIPAQSYFAVKMLKGGKDLLNP